MFMFSSSFPALTGCFSRHRKGVLTRFGESERFACALFSDMLRIIPAKREV